MIGFWKKGGLSIWLKDFVVFPPRLYWGYRFFLQQGSHFMRQSIEGLGTELQRKGISRQMKWGAKGILCAFTWSLWRFSDLYKLEITWHENWVTAPYTRWSVPCSHQKHLFKQRLIWTLKLTVRGTSAVLNQLWMHRCPAYPSLNWCLSSNGATKYQKKTTYSRVNIICIPCEESNKFFWSALRRFTEIASGECFVFDWSRFASYPFYCRVL